MTNQYPFKKMVLKITGSKGSALEDARSRLQIISYLIMLGFIIVGIRVFDLTTIQGQFAPKDANETVPLAREVNRYAPMRSDIYDRNGVLLATSLNTSSLFVDPARVVDPVVSAKALVEILPSLTYEDVLKKMKGKGRFSWLKRNITPDEQYKILHIGEPGFGFRQERRRMYPQGNLTSHIVGYTNVDGKGLAGIERSFNNHLSDGDGPLNTSLDVRVQHIVYRELSKAIKKFSGTGGAAIVLDITTGEVIAAVSLPDFDPHFPNAVDKEATFNRLTLGVYELGSTFKLFSTAAFLERNKGNIGYKFDARAPLQRYGFQIRDYRAKNQLFTAAEVFMYSSNIGSALMAENVGTDYLVNFYKDLGLLAAPKIAIDEVGRPIIPKPWRDVHSLTASYGHGLAVSPLQLVSGAASVLGGGLKVDPQFLRVDKQTKKSAEIRVLSPEISEKMRQLMRLVVTDGTAKSADVDGYAVGGKTGTAEQPGAGGYNRRKLISSILSVFPANDPKFIIYVMVQDPVGIKETYNYATGGWVAAPVVKEIVTNLGPLLNIAPQSTSNENDYAAPLRKYIAQKPKG
jgi:cell division protein FtsI (penicillin-binding protein 3)